MTMRAVVLLLRRLAILLFLGFSDLVLRCTALRLRLRLILVLGLAIAVVVVQVREMRFAEERDSGGVVGGGGAGGRIAGDA